MKQTEIKPWLAIGSIAAVGGGLIYILAKGRRISKRPGESLLLVGKVKNKSFYTATTVTVPGMVKVLAPFTFGFRVVINNIEHSRLSTVSFAPSETKEIRMAGETPQLLPGRYMVYLKADAWGRSIAEFQVGEIEIKEV